MDDFLVCQLHEVDQMVGPGHGGFRDLVVPAGQRERFFLQRSDWKIRGENEQDLNNER